MAKMENVKYEIKDNILHVWTKLGEDSHPAKSGNTMLIADTHGWKTLYLNGEEQEQELTMMVRRPFRDDER